ncbi:MAG: biopolymer transporter ExbD [Chthoniobacterales bacterium]|nr:biopolymer transporter ExbD [Chthoniobacterales bacterium]MCX7713408.1 biopolymer transporter ExbD [Chthoniobacterales bacterium]
MSADIPRRGKSHSKVRPPEPEADPEFQIAPMIDILLVLLVFFMSISSTEVLQSVEGINLPVAADAKEAKSNPGQVIINISYNMINNATVITIQDVNYNIPDLVPLLQAQVSRNPLVRVLVRADRNVRYEFLRRVLETVGQAGVGNVTFAVVDKEIPK